VWYKKKQERKFLGVQKMDIASAVKSGVKPNFLISLVVALAVLALVNGFLPAQYKIGKLIGGLFA
jgi:hypothetical protein